MNPTRASRFPAYPVVILLLLILLFGIFTYKDYGETFDNHFDMMYGQYMVHFLKTGDRAFEVDEALQLTRYYGPVGDTLAGLFIEPFMPLPYGKAVELRHLYNFLITILGFIAAYHFTRMALGRRAGLFAVALLALSPTLYGHAFNNSKDIIFAAFYIFSLWGVLFYLQNRNIKRLLLCAFITGVCMDQRVGAIFIYPAFFFATLCAEWKERTGVAEESEEKTGLLAAAFLATIKASVIFTVVSAVTIYAFFPFLWPDPLTRFIEVFRVMSAFPDVKLTFFMGNYEETSNLPRIYIPLLLHITMPLLTILFIYAGLFFGAWGFIKKRLTDNESYLLIITILAVLVPASVVIVQKSPLYDSVRHFLFTFYPLTILAAFGMESILKRLHGARLKAAALLTVAYYAFILYTMAMLHPYQSIYFNELTGGLKGASTYFETDYWGGSYKEGIEWLNDNTVGEVGVDSGSHFNMTHYFRSGITLDGQNPDFYISTTRYGDDKAVSSEPVHVVERLGTPLLYIKPVSPRALSLLRTKAGGE